MKITRIFLALMLAILAPRFASANLVGPYTPDANTLVLLHFDEAAGGSVTTNNGSLGQRFYSVNFSSSGEYPPVVTTMLGAAGYTNAAAAIGFNLCETNSTTGYEWGFDYNKDGEFEADQGGSGASLDAVPMSVLGIGNGGQTPFTLEALIQPTNTTSTQEIICTDSGQANRCFQFRITGGTLAFQFIANSQAMSANIPTSGNDAYVPGNWYHVAFVYDGAHGTLYWTLLNPTNGAAHVLGTPAALTINATDGTYSGPLVVANRGRPTGSETFLGSIDEVRISNVARAANQMQFFSPLVTITQNPISQNVDYNQPVTFSVGASSLTALGYQWLFNSNGIAGATNTTYVITNVAAANAGYYSCMVSNISGNSVTSSPALLVVGAANFLNHRYSFTVDDTDSIGGANGTNFGDATVSGGQLVLDGTAGTYMQLPPNLFNAANATALTVEFWATYGVNANNAYVFSFGYTNFLIGSGIVAVNFADYSPHNSTGQGLFISPGDYEFEQQATAPTTLDGLTMHVACVIDPPDGILAIYTNGVVESINTNLTVNVANVNDTLSYVGASLSAADPNLNASIDELRIYKGALSSLSIKQSDDQGPNVVLASGPVSFVTQPNADTVPAGQTATFTAAAVGYLPITYQWFKNGTLIPGATNASVSFLTAIGDNGASIKCYATNTIGVTTYVTNSATVSLTVFTPPTFSWLGTADGGADQSWNTTSFDWTNDASGGGILVYTQTNGVLFDDRSGGGSVDLEQAILPYNITVNAANNYQFTSSGLLGSLAGQTAITKLNSGTLQIDLTNNLSGPVTISGGELQIGNDDAYGSLGSSAVTNNATLSINRGDAALNVANAIHGTGTVSFDGTGSVTVSGNSDYSGSTLINEGIVFLQSATGLGSTITGTMVENNAQLYVTANVNLGEGLTLNGAGDGNGALRKGGAGLTVETAPMFLAADSSIGVDSGATLTLSNIVSGPQALTALGSGTLTLNTNNSFSGGFTLDGPVVGVDSTAALGTNVVTVSGTGRFVIGTGLNIANAFNAGTVSPGVLTGLLMVNDNTNGTVTTVSGPLTFGEAAVNGGNFVGPTSSGYLNVSGPVSAAGYPVSVRLGYVRFSGGGNYSGMQVRANTSSIGADNGVATNATMDIGGNGSPTIPTFFDLNGFNQLLVGLQNLVTPANLGMVTNSSATLKTLTLNPGAGNSYSFNGAVVGNLALTVVSGTQTFTGTNTYTGTTTANGGTLELATASVYSNSTVNVANGGMLQLDFAVTNQVAALVLDGVTQPNGIYNNNNVPTYITGSGSLLVSPTVNTTPPYFTATVSGGKLIVTWPADHTGWRLLVQTNSLSSGLNPSSNAWSTVSGSTTVNSVTNAINAANGTVFYRMVYP